MQTIKKPVSILLAVLTLLLTWTAAGAENAAVTIGYLGAW